MARILCLLALGVVLYGNTRYFLYEEAKIAKDTYLEKKQESRDFYIHSSPMFFKPKTVPTFQ